MRALAIITIVAGIACSTPPLQITLQLDDSPSASCGLTTDCQDIPLGCDPYLMLRIVDPTNPTDPDPPVNMCQALVLNTKHDLCSLYNVQVDANRDAPNKSMDVQVVLFNKSDLATSDDGDPVCPTNMQFAAASGYPLQGIVSGDGARNTPAIGGHAYWHPGDSEVVVKLGCTDLDRVSPVTCEQIPITNVHASIVDLDNPVASVSPSAAQSLVVSVGEPQAMITGYVFNEPGEQLVRTPEDPPGWHGDFSAVFQSSECIQVIDTSTAETTPTLTCQATSPESPIDATAVLLAKKSLQAILAAVGKTTVPDQGIVIGLVVDRDLKPKPGVTVIPSDGSVVVEYLNFNRTMRDGTSTSTSGMFVVEDTPYTTVFGASDGTTTIPDVPGGIVMGKVTIVMLRFP